MKELEIRFAGLFSVGPAHHHQCPYRREAKGELMQAHPGGGVKTEAEIAVTWPSNSDSHQELEEARNRFFSKATGGSTAADTFISAP